MAFKDTKRNIERKHITPTSAIESYIIDKIVRIYPQWVTPDLLTFSAFFFGLLLLPVYYLSNFNPSFIWVASLLYFLHWFTDATDGSLAIYRKRPRPNYGNYIDHTLDSITLIAMILGLGISPILSIEVSLALLFVFFIWDLQAAYLSSYEKVVRISTHGFGGTEGRMLVILLQTHWFFFQDNIIFGMPAMELIAWTVLAVMSVFVIRDVIKNASYLKAVDETKLPKTGKR